MNKSETVWVPYHGFIVAETEKAIGLADDLLDDVRCWIPKSQIESIEYEEPEAAGADDFVRNIMLDGLEIPMWLADEHGLEYDDHAEYYGV